MTQAQLLTLAAATLATVPHQATVTPQLLAAICWQESSGDPRAVGDTGAAIGLAQFHLDTWDRFKTRTSCIAFHGPDRRLCAECSMLTLVQECNHAALANSHQTIPIADTCARFHNSGKLDGKRTAYVLRVKRAMKEFEQLAKPVPKKPARSTRRK